jgi:hypothetical protein
MHTRVDHALTNGSTDEHGLGDAVRHVTEHASALMRLEAQLAAIELRSKVSSLGIGIGVGIAAGLFGMLAIGFGFAAVAAALSLVMATWAALLVTVGILLVLTAICGAVAAAKLRRATPPFPEQAVAEARLTTQELGR